MKRPRVLIDVDGPLTDGFFETACHHLRARGVDAKPWAISDWDIFKSFETSARDEDAVRKILRGPGIAASFSPRPGALEFLNEMRAWADVYAVTAPLDGSPTWAHERETWLIERLAFNPQHVISARDKSIVVGDVLIDDKFSTVESWQAAHPESLAVLWREAHNRKESWHTTAGDYDELRRTIAIKCFMSATSAKTAVSEK